MNMKLSHKLISGFLFIAIITLIVGIIGYYGISVVREDLEEVGLVRLPSIEYLMRTEIALEELMLAQRSTLSEMLTLEQREHYIRQFYSSREIYREAWGNFMKLPANDEETRLSRRFEQEVAEWAQLNNRWLQMNESFVNIGILDPGELVENLMRFRGDHYELERNVLLLIYTDEEFDGGADPNACNFGRWVAEVSINNVEFNRLLNNIQQSHNDFHHVVRDIRNQLSAGNRDRAIDLYRNRMQPSAQQVFTGFDRMIQFAEEADNLRNEMTQLVLGDISVEAYEAMEILESLIEINENIAANAVNEGISVANRMTVSAIVAVIAGFSIAIFLGIFLSLTLTNSLNKAIEQLNTGANEVASASEETSAASQNVAGGASELASSIEETSASLEELTSMVQNNAENAKKANLLTIEAKQVVEHANISMREMQESMNEIKHNSDEISKIIKIIEEIAFQTNLLALNAAVEAARAGEHGRGFAVVAEEVRNLAQRAGSSAKDTGGLIAKAVNNVNTGLEKFESLITALNENSASTQKVANLIQEISNASKEQATGIDQITQASSEMDKVVQNLAANSEEAASASEEMSSQAIMLKEVVDSLVALVEGTGKGLNKEFSKNNFNDSQKGLTKKV